LPENMLSIGIIAVGFVLVMVAVFLPKIVKLRRPVTAEEALPSATSDSLRALERVEDSTLKLEEASRELFGRLDTRSRMLIRLIEEAELKIRELDERLPKRGDRA
jgi:hypothetical protein